jgi:hypothetical protein
MNPRVSAAIIYFSLALLACLGVIGVVGVGSPSSRGHGRASRSLSRLLFALAVVPALVVFFLGEDYFHAGLVQGAEQAGLFSAAALSATAVHAVVISLIRQIHTVR